MVRNSGGSDRKYMNKKLIFDPLNIDKPSWVEKQFLGKEPIMNESESQKKPKISCTVSPETIEALNSFCGKMIKKSAFVEQAIMEKIRKEKPEQ